MGLLGTIVENDWKIFNKVVGGMKNIFKKDNKITLLKWKFSRKNYCVLKKMNLTSCRWRLFISLNFRIILVNIKTFKTRYVFLLQNAPIKEWTITTADHFNFISTIIYSNRLKTVPLHTKKTWRLDHKLVQDFLNEIFTRNVALNENILDGFLYLKTTINSAENIWVWVKIKLRRITW